MRLPELKPAQKPLIFVVWADPKPQVTAIVECRQRAKARTRPHRPEVMLDSLEAEGFQAGLLLPKQEILARDSLNLGRQLLEARPKLRERGRFHGKGVALPAR
jgi:hypothetical protein